MRFVFTLTVSTFTGKPVQEVIGEVAGINSIRELHTSLQKGLKWILVERFYQRDTPKGADWESRGFVIVHDHQIGLVKEFTETRT